MKLMPLLVTFMLSGLAYADELPFPPALKDEPVEELAYFRTIYSNWNNLVIVIANPNGSRNGKTGDLIAYNNSGSWKLCLNTDGGTTWRCSANALTAP